MAASQHRRKEKINTAFNSGIYCLTAEVYSLGRNNIDVVGQMLAAGARIVQYREKEKSIREKLAECRQIREMTRRSGALFIVNDDIALALAVGADGVHVGQDDMPVPETRALVGNKMIIGLSTHTPAQAHAATACGADYIGVGPMFGTYTKKDVCDPVGFTYLEYVARNIALPFVAIGGIKEHHVSALVNRGATCVALVTEIVGSEDIGKKIESIRNLLRPACPS